jgi:signal peptidase II
MQARRTGFWTALAVIIADQATKSAVIDGLNLELSGPVALGPFIDLVLVWNRGISYGLFQQHAEIGRYGLTLLALGAAIGFGIWLWRTNRLLPALGIGLIVGGAIGNAIDRLYRGAVVDFILLHYEEWRWYVFNVADAAIVIGVALLLTDSWLGNGETNEPATPKDQPS